MHAVPSYKTWLSETLQSLPMLRELGVLTDYYAWLDAIHMDKGIIVYQAIPSLDTPAIFPEME